ncbi:unnamed protein product, partial [Oppiella nova]
MKIKPHACVWPGCTYRCTLKGNLNKHMRVHQKSDTHLKTSTMETMLEQQRRYHEERERLEEAMVKENMTKKSSNRDQINSDHRLKILLDRYTECTENLLEIYEDKDGARKAEVDAMSGPNEFSEFYSRLKNIKEFY